MPDGTNPEPWLLAGWQEEANACQLSETRALWRIHLVLLHWVFLQKNSSSGWKLSQSLVGQEMQGNGTHT